MTRQSLAIATAIESEVEPPVEWPSTRAEFESFVDRYKDPLARYALRRLGSVHDAEDAVQEVFLRAFGRLGDRSVKRPLAYLYRMTANACTDTLRRRRRTAESLDRASRGVVFDAKPDGRDAVGALDDLARLERLLAWLPRRQAEVIRLRIWDELSFPEIGQVLGRSLPTVKSRFRYGLEKLRNLLDLEEVRHEVQ